MLVKQVYEVMVDILAVILKGDTFSHKMSFYKTLKQSEVVYQLCSVKIADLLDINQLNTIIDLSLKIIQKDNYPLLRQFIEIVLCRCYLVINSKNPQNPRRAQLIEMIKVSLNIGVPLVLTLGYELIDYCRHPERYEGSGNSIMEIHEFLVKFISCHTAYLRAICQYYLSLFLDLMPVNDPFLLNLGKYWK